MKILVTGGSGFIGSHLIHKLIEKPNFEVKNLDLKDTRITKEGFETIKGDIRDVNLIEQLVSSNDVIFHMAAMLGVENIIANPLESLDVNLNGSLNILKACSKYKKPILISSSSEIYGDTSEQPIYESSRRVLGSPFNYRWVYSESKALEESAAAFHRVKDGLDFIVARFFNTVGPGQNGKYGMVVPRFVMAALKNQDLEVYGDGTQSRVFCHVTDAVGAITALMFNDPKYGEAYNIGGEVEISILNLAKRIVDLLNSKSTIKLIPYSQKYKAGFEDMKRRVPNTSKLRKVTNWSPKFGLDDIILDVAKSFS